MEITEIRVKLMEASKERLQAFCSITFDACFVIRDLKIIQGAKGAFVAMPSRKLSDRCPRCGNKNHLRSNFCSQCGTKLDPERVSKDFDGRAKLYADIAHPINSKCREMIQQHVIKAFEEELIRAEQPGYKCTYDDFGEEDFATIYEEEVEAAPRKQNAPEDGTSRHVEPATNQPVGSGPHTLHAEKQAKHSTTIKADSADNEDNFGAGIV